MFLETSILFFFSKERVGWGVSSISSENVDCLNFTKFISQMDLINLPILERKITWFQPNGRATSSLIRLWCLMDGGTIVVKCLGGHFLGVCLIIDMVSSSVSLECEALSNLDLIINDYLMVTFLI